MATTVLLQFARGQPPAKRRVRRETIRHQGRLNTLCQRLRDGDVSVDQCRTLFDYADCREWAGLVWLTLTGFICVLITKSMCGTRQFLD